MAPTDAKLHEMIKEGDVKAFETIFREYFKPLCIYANGILKDMDLAQEVVQEFFYNYWRNKENIAINVSLNAYMYQSVKNYALKQIDRQNVRSQYANSLSLEPKGSESDASDNIEAAEMARLVNRTLSQMPPRCREIFLMSRTEGLKYHEIAKRLKISIKTVEANMGKALSMFRTSLKQFDKYAY